MGIYSDNFFSWLDRQRDAEKAVMDEGYTHPDGKPCKASKKENCPFYKKDMYKAEGIDDLKVNSEVSKVEKTATATEMETIRKGGNPNEDKFEKVVPSDLATMKVGSTKSKWRELRNKEVQYVADRGLVDGTYPLVDVTDEKEQSKLEPIEYSNGYMVSFQTTNGEGFNKVRKDLQLSDEEYDRIAEDLIRDLTEIQGKSAIPHVGIFGGIPEISFKVQSIDLAMKLARKYNQVSIWDNAKGAYAKEQDANPDLSDAEKADFWSAANILNSQYDWKTNQVYKVK